MWRLLGLLSSLFAGIPPALADTINVDTATGPALVETAPETIAVFDAPAIDTLEALGVTVDAAPAPLYLDYLEDYVKDATRVGTLFEPDYEALAVLAPDLIIAGSRSATQVEALGQIAPTLDMSIWGTDMVAQTIIRLHTYGAIFDRKSEAEKQIAILKTAIADAQNAVAGKGKALILLTNGGKISAYGDDSRFGWLHTATGLPEAYPAVSAQTHGEAISFEFIAELDPDWLLVIDRGAAVGASGAAARATLDNRLMAKTKAARKQQIVYLSAGPLYIAGGGVQSMLISLEELTEAFSGGGF